MYHVLFCRVDMLNLVSDNLSLTTLFIICLDLSHLNNGGLMTPEEEMEVTQKLQESQKS